MWPNFQNHHGRIFPAQRTARGICPQHVDGLGVKTDEMRVVQSHSHGWAYGWMWMTTHMMHCVHHVRDARRTRIVDRATRMSSDY